MLLDYVSSKGGDRRLHPGAGARGRAGRDHGQRDRARARSPPTPRRSTPTPRATTSGCSTSSACKRRGTPEDIGNLVVFLASDASSFITGQTDRDRRRLGDALGRWARSTARSRSSPERGTGSARRSRAALADAGARVAVTHHDQAVAEGLAAELGPEHAGFALDVRSTASVDAAAAAVAERLGEPTVLVNSAGVNKIGPAESFTDDDWERILDVNLTGVLPVLPGVRRAHAGGRARLHRQHRARSSAPQVGMPGRAPYGASKAGDRRPDAGARCRVGRPRRARERAPARPGADADGRARRSRRGRSSSRR